MTMSKRVVTILGSVAWLSGCCMGGGDVAPTASGTPELLGAPEAPAVEGPPTDAASFIRQAAAVGGGDCDYYTRCCSQADRSADGMLDTIISGSCLGALAGAFGSSMAEEAARPLIDAVTAGRVRFDAAAAATCLTAMRAATPAVLATCGGPNPRGPAGHVPMYSDLTECSGVFTGTLADAATCTLDQECTSGACAPGADLGGPMTCRPTSSAGGECSYDGNGCRAPLICSNGHCVAQGHEGEACDPLTILVCVSPLRCHAAEGAEQGTCVAPSAGGAECAEDYDCASGHCDSGHCRTQCMGAT